MGSEIIKVSMRAFRAHLPQYLLAATPVAITRHGKTTGLYIPAQTHYETHEQDQNALKIAADRLDQLLKEQALTEEALLIRVLSKPY